MSDIDALLAEIPDLEEALDRTNDPAKETRLRLALASRRAQLADLQRRAR